MPPPAGSPPSAKALTAAFQAALAPLADVERAAPMRAYMRDQFDFLGIPTPARRHATAAWIKQKLPASTLIATAQSLWRLPQREYQYAAADLLARQWATLSLDDIPTLLALVQQKSWWDTVDPLAGVVGDILRAHLPDGNDPQVLMDAALNHDNLWVRRVAMLHQLGWRSDTDTARLWRYALQLAPEADFFIRKAIGWALRDYARHAPDAVRAFLNQHRPALSALTLREAGKHLGE
ncbi:MAG TPA: DNA alkylation repair protein [Aquabacterium sp.]|uniref:DNA alkylation repair protein n=1 Tax=Aquabacterium sp. TaxID=1872578 RepID=UPI002E31B3F8|nr:DNA alkylation repair protein [Aquabacterium sp.]HEX5357738.1 DNA alkylation repair protein [Aquabacterium sp.]